jgi:hypothetical protein
MKPLRVVVPRSGDDSSPPRCELPPNNYNSLSRTRSDTEPPEPLINYECDVCDRAHGNFESHHGAFLSVYFLIFLCAVLLLRSLEVVAFINGVFLMAASLGAMAAELYQPAALLDTIVAWNKYATRGTLLLWCSAVAMNGSVVLGAVSFMLSLCILCAPVILGDNAPLLLPVFTPTITKKEYMGDEETKLST